ncbi:MAG: hypothetical protein GIKADHBN_01752 [Phycisphaerales bacterium]|nr:hypothetical protein [Phycisphaerales bacterium]
MFLGWLAKPRCATWQQSRALTGEDRFAQSSPVESFTPSVA